MHPVPRLWVIFTIFHFLLGPATDVARAENVDPALLDACLGYNATNMKADGPKLTAKLVLTSTPYNIFGNDVKVLDLTVVYETGEPSSHHMAAPVRLASFHQVPVSSLDLKLSDLGSSPMATPLLSAPCLGRDSLGNISVPPAHYRSLPEDPSLPLSSPHTPIQLRLNKQELYNLVS